jgi:PAS domain S-box-containing protein
LNAARDEYHSLLDNLPDGLVRCVPVYEAGTLVDFQIVEINAALARVLGRSREELAGARVGDVVPGLKETGGEWMVPYAAVAREGAPIIMERHARSFDRWYDVTAYRDISGAVVAVFHDITERKRATEALRRSEQRYRSLFEHSIDAVYLVSPDGDYIEANQSWLEMFHYSREELARARAIDFYADPREREDFLRRIDETGRVQDVVKLKRWDGSVFDCERKVVALKDDSGQVIAFQGLHRNITAQLTAERSLRESEANLRALLDATTDGACLMDLDGTIVALNEEMARRHGISAKDLIGTCAWDSLPKEVVPGRKAKVAEVIGAGRPARFEDTRSGRRILSSVWPIVDSGGRVVRVAVFGRDVSEERRGERELRDSREELRLLAARQQEVREQERLGIARELHDEMGQQLTVLKMDLHRARKRLRAGEMVVEEELSRMMGVVDQMARDVRRISSELRPGVLDDLGLVAAMEWQTSQFQARTGISCSMEVGPEEDLDVERSLSITLFRVLQELLTNVARHAQARSVRASLSHADGKYVLVVADDGKGISVSAAESHTSLGLVGMRERLRPYAGTLVYECPVSGGTIARVVVPALSEVVNVGTAGEAATAAQQ